MDEMSSLFFKRPSLSRSRSLVVVVYGRVRVSSDLDWKQIWWRVADCDEMEGCKEDWMADRWMGASGSTRD